MRLHIQLVRLIYSRFEIDHELASIEFPVKLRAIIMRFMNTNNPARHSKEMFELFLNKTQYHDYFN